MQAFFVILLNNHLILAMSKALSIFVVIKLVREVGVDGPEDVARLPGQLDEQLQLCLSVQTPSGPGK